MGNFIDRTGDRYGRLTVLRRVVRPGKVRIYWLCICACGTEAVVEAGKLKSGTGSCGCLQRDRTSAANRREVPSYQAMHKRIAKDRGPAREYDCVDCGGAAAHWSYDHADLNELVGPVGRERFDAAYSLDPEHYVPRCVPCHKTHDLGVSA